MASRAGADGFEKVLMPGPVARAHAEIEAECSRCHRPFQQEDESALCRDCHEPVASDVDAGLGLHGRRAPGAACRTCHTEHRGREADIVGLDAGTLDHDLTDFPLRGRHVATECRGCHLPDRPHRKAPSTCLACHGENDPHRGSLGDSCEKCHSERDWRVSTFDHGRTDFPLVGKHEQVPCASCHPNDVYEKAPNDCASCHRVHDVHLGRYGPRCEDCHDSRGWDRIAFDHDRATRFPLAGAHRALDCDRCHQGDLYEDKLDTRCYACHRTDDEHKGRFGVKCESCHVEKSWKSDLFVHGEATRFALRGRHEALGCESCHTEVVSKARLDTGCRACHAADDVHRGQQGDDCARCHRESGWRKDLFFDHDLARFPLLGLHALAACEECHASAAFGEASSECAACHQRDDFHKRRLGSSCDQCHNPNGWTLWIFDHSERTSFPLEGAHEPLACQTCHAAPVDGAIHLSKSCADCHQRDDVHQGSYGRSCDRCHSASSWQAVSLGP